jgi:hypothetical protein
LGGLRKLEQKYERCGLALEYDVIVTGGGVTGCCAAIAAARSGARTLIIEKNGFLGGNMASGLPWLGFHDKASGKQVIGGLPWEIIDEMQSSGDATDFVFDPITGSAVGVNAAMLKFTLLKKLQSAGASVLFHSMLAGTETNHQTITKLKVQTKQGLLDFTAKMFVDCTDSGDMCVLSGSEYVNGRAYDGKRQVSSLAMMVANIQFQEMLEYFKSHPAQIRPFPLSPELTNRLLEQMASAPVVVIGAFRDIVEKARQDGVPYPRSNLIGVVYPKVSEMVLVASRLEDVDVNNAQSYSYGEAEALMQSEGIMTLLRQYIPGCRSARLSGVGPQLGIRETRHIICDYMLTADDLLTAHPFPDAIAKGAYHMDIHSPDHDGLETKQPPVYQIPFRCLLPRNLENALIAGRCIGATHEAMSSTRVAPIVSALGEAAGTAAAMAANQNIQAKKLSVSDLQARLRENGAI